MSRATEINIKDFVKQYKKIPPINKNTVYVTPKEYAEIIKSHPVTVLRWLAKGKIEGAFKAEGRWKIPVIGT